jgi:hypothetical protein
MLLEVHESVISPETFPFVERHYTEFANVPCFTPFFFFVNCANKAWPSKILPLALFAFHNFHEDMFPHITRKLPRGGST